VFSPDFIEQPEVTMMAADAEKYTHELAPVNPGTPADEFTLTRSDFEVLYKFKEALVDDFGQTPPVFSTLPWTTFSS